MSVMETRQGSGHRNRRYAPRARYQRFSAPAGDGFDALALARSHAQWLVANMDWFAAQGRGALASASVALQRDLRLLAAPPAAQAPPAAPAQPDEQALTVVLEQQSQFVENLKQKVSRAKHMGHKLEKEFTELACHDPQRSKWNQQRWEEIWRLLNEIHLL